MADDEPTREPVDEDWEVFRHRYDEARQAGLEHADAEFFAASRTDVGLLRKLVAAGVPPHTIARILV